MTNYFFLNAFIHYFYIQTTFAFKPSFNQNCIFLKKKIFLLQVSLLSFILRKCIGVKGIMVHVGVCFNNAHNHVLKCL